jgi:hypothetical protein
MQTQEQQVRHNGVFEYANHARHEFPLMPGQSGDLSADSPVNTSKQQLILGKASSQGINQSYATSNRGSSPSAGLPYQQAP